MAYLPLKRRIITLQLRPGEMFTEAQAMEWTGKGRTPVREALALLVRDGLVRSRPRVGYEVTAITLRDVQELFQLRLIVEPAAVELAAQRVGDGIVEAQHLRHLEALCGGAYDHTIPDSIAAFLDANEDFHTSVAVMSGNRRLAELVARIIEDSRRFTHLRLTHSPASARFVHEHRELLDRLLHADGPAAAAIARTQIEQAHAEVVSWIVNDHLASSPIEAGVPDAPPAGR